MLLASGFGNLLTCRMSIHSGAFSTPWAPPGLSRTCEHPKAFGWPTATWQRIGVDKDSGRMHIKDILKHREAIQFYNRLLKWQLHPSAGPLVIDTNVPDVRCDLLLGLTKPRPGHICIATRFSFHLQPLKEPDHLVALR